MHTETCEACSFVMEFERHPSDWSNHPGDAGQVRVAVECPECGHAQYTDGCAETEYVAVQSAALMAELRAEVAARLNSSVEPVFAGEAGGGADVSGG